MSKQSNVILSHEYNNILFIYFDKYFNLWDLATNTAANFVKGEGRRNLYF